MISKRRQNCLNELLKTDLDGVLYAGSANFQYLSECTSYHWQRNAFNLEAPIAGSHLIPECMIYMNREGKVTILCIPRLKDYFPGHDVVISYMDQFEDELAQIVDGKKIGIGRDCDVWLKETFKEVDPEIELVCAEELFYEIRKIKDEKEIAHLRKMAKFTDDAIMHVVKNLKEGMTQYEVERAIMEYGFVHGMQDLGFQPTAGLKTRKTFKSPEENFIFDRNTKLVPGTGIAFDVGYMDQGYCSDWGRSVYYGKAPEHVKNGYFALQACQTYMISKIVPNQTKVGELYGFIWEKAVELGYEQYLRFKIGTGASNGHMIGIEVHELPWIKEDCEEVLRPGMVFCSEPKMMFPEECYTRVEDMILITEEGAVSLSEFPRDLFEIEVK